VERDSAEPDAIHAVAAAEAGEYSDSPHTLSSSDFATRAMKRSSRALSPPLRGPTLAFPGRSRPRSSLRRQTIVRS